MPSFEAELRERLGAIRNQGLWRELRRVDSPQGPQIEIGGRKLLNFSSNDYLGLANHPALREGAVKAVTDFGAGAGASRLICGSLKPFHELEETLAEFKGTEAALTFSTGYAAALGTVTALLDRDDIIILDKLVHASIVDATRLSGARLRVFAHNDLEDLEAKLQWAQDQIRSPGSKTRILIVTESVFSMDGDHAPLAEIVALKEKHGAWLMVDEAHATGLYGEHRRGLAEALGVSEHIEIQMGTLGKALGASGGYVCGSRVLIDYLVNLARSFIFSTAPVPAAAAAAIAGIRLVQSEEGTQLNSALWKNVSMLHSAINQPDSALRTPRSALRTPRSALRTPRSAFPSAIIPILIGDEEAAVAGATALREKGLFVPAIRYPTVARGSARLRVTLTAGHSVNEVEMLGEELLRIADGDSR